ncbi:MAG: efflux RND transporter periplasmic adaptor subunit [Pseudomonadota bacterium]
MMHKIYPSAALAVCLVFGLPATAEPLDAVCVTESFKDATLSFTVPGRIVKILHREGRRVTAGTPLVELENEVEALEVERRYLIWQDKSDLEAARAQNETFKVLLDSTRGLFESTGSVSREDLYKMELEYNASLAEYRRLVIAEQREEVEHKLAQANLAQRTLKAPFDGTIVDVMLDEGEICEAYQPLLQLVDVTRGFLVCNIEEPVGRLLSENTPLPFEIPAGVGGLSGEASVVYVAPVVDPASGLLRVRLQFDNPGGVVKPGVPGYVTLDPQALSGSD